MRKLLGTLVLVAACEGDPDDRTPDAGRPRDAGQHNDSSATSASSEEDAAPGAEPDDASTPTTGMDASGSLGGGASPYFTHGAFFLDDVSGAAKAANSEAAIKALRARGGFGNGDVFQIDFSIDVLSASASTEKKTFTTRTEANGLDDEFYTPDCDHVPMPVPSGGNVEGESGYTCAGDGDCHLIVWSASEQKLYEMWRADITGARFIGGCLAVWDTSRALPVSGRGLQCSSADAAGFPIAPLLFTADEVAAGEIKHAIRFILPNDRTQRGFVPPATHGTNTSGAAGAPYYGVHLRLRKDFALERLPNEGARVVARALQRYGMYHADGGNIALTAQSDKHTQRKWSGLLGPRDLSMLKVEDFDVIDHGAPIPLTYDCRR
jgi:serine/threonine-protein kinase